ncbi:MAG: polysaccharide deacetylase family protein [Candidatus Paceibacterota bacterium]|jgi:peptidoglycan/xylan/chitin deacetylase (PgdA/CDA1 family)
MIKKIKNWADYIGLRSLLRTGYQVGLWSWQKIINFGDKYQPGPKAIILTYHRVADLSADPLQLAVNPHRFEEQIKSLKARFNIIALPELVTRLKNRDLQGNELAITFDDGYRDNLVNALPIAQKYNVPITIFIIGNIASQNKTFSWDPAYANKPGAYLNQAEIEQLALNPLVTLGSHTLNHPRLIDLNEQEQEAEISAGKEQLELIINKKIDYFAYPFGGYTDISRATIDLVKKTGHRAGFTTERRAVKLQTNPLAIPRIMVRNWNAAELLKRLRALILTK